MKQILQVSILILLLLNVYQKIKQISLKKDEQKKILVKYANNKRLFKFRWTLYVNKALVVFHSYGNKEQQNVLYLNNQNQSFVVELKSKGAEVYGIPSFLIKFKKFDFKLNTAIFELYLADKKSQIGMEYLKNE